ncbi:hypothetical protein ACOSP7_013122 [Xanthoceras sorbifolium]
MVRGIIADCFCGVYGESCEDLNHLFKKCPVALKVWEGCVVRNSDKVWLAGFAMKKGVGSMLGDKLWNILKGLKLAWKMGWSKVIVETDSMEAVDCLKITYVDNHPLWGIIQNCRTLIKVDWYCHISHVFREGNGVASGLALMGQAMEKNYGFFSSPPTAVLKLLRMICVGLLCLE